MWVNEELLEIKEKHREIEADLPLKELKGKKTDIAKEWSPTLTLTEMNERSMPNLFLTTTEYVPESSGVMLLIVNRK